MTSRQVIVRYLVLTFVLAVIAASVTGVLGHLGYPVRGFVTSIGEMLGNLPFAIYILSPAIASFIILTRAGAVSSPQEWLRTVFYVKNSPWLYLYVIAVLTLYFSLHLAISGPSEAALPATMFVLSLPGNLIIGGLEEAGWVYVLQSHFNRRVGYVQSSLMVSVVWVLWHVPLFWIPGTNHSSGVIDFWMFTLQLVVFRFLYGAITVISGQGAVFLCVLTHTMFNAASSTVGIPPATWAGTVVANLGVLLVAGGTVAIYRQRHPRSQETTLWAAA